VFSRALLTFALLSAVARLGLADGAHPPELDQAYQRLAAKDYDSAIELFRKALVAMPGNAAVHKDLAYTLLKAGDNADARDEFEQAVRIDPKDETAALEFAFLAFETKKPIEARRTFDALRQTGTAATRATAEQAFQNIDRPLADGIARWKEAIAKSPTPNDISMFSAHWELAQLAELRDESQLAAEQYEICYKLKPQLSELLVILARVWQSCGRAEEAHAALLAASRQRNPRTAELGLESMGQRYPYPYEFVNALKLDPTNTALRRELAYLYVAMGQEKQAAEQFEQLLKIDPSDRQARRQLNALLGIKTNDEPAAPVKAAAATGATDLATDPKAMGLKSFQLGYLKDAIRFLKQAHELDPADFEVTLKLAWAYNQAKDDDQALAYFAEARNADDPQIATEATKAYHTLNGDVLPQTTIWALPMFSSRWNDLFSYGQAKRTLPQLLPKNWDKLVSLYVSMRFLGDLKSSLPAYTIDGQYLSESSFIFGLGASSRTWHHLTGWAEAGEAIKYLPGRRDIGAAIPDYRGGMNFAKGFGQLMGSSKSGYYYETTADAIYVSRFDKDWMFYSQQRGGRTIQLRGSNKLQALFNVNLLHDLKNQYWANTLEFGPGVRFHASWMPPNAYFSADFLRGVYTENKYNPRGPNYNDIRVSFWYAITK
jgi:tetratricopeptide (TPR) repeat protein